MITSLRLQNFKLFKDQSFEFKNLNLLTGLNGMGKSTAIQALLLLREAKFDRILLTEGLNLKENKLFNVGKIEDLRYEFAERPYKISIDLGLNNQKNTFIYDGEKSKRKFFIDLKDKQIADENNMEKESLFDEENFVYLQADRIIPKDSYPIGTGQKNKFGNQGEYSIDFYHQNKNTFLVDKHLCLGESSTLAAQVKLWLCYVSPEIKIYTTPNDNSIHLDYTFHNSNKHFDPINVGFGITYCLPIIIALLSAKPNDLLIIENPESHLHPKGQSKLAELMCLAAQNGVQIFCETHSDHIFYGTRVAIKEGKVEPEKVKTYYFDRSKTEYNSVVHCININKKGRIIGDMPDGFFDQYEINLDKLL
jgi:predicted ATPase